MKKITAATLLSIAMFLFAGTLQAQVTADYDKTADFSTYKTYSFLGWQKDSDSILNDFDRKRLQDSFRSEFAARGLTYDENGGDMAVSLYIFVQSKTDVTAYTNYSGGLGYGRAGWGVGYGMGYGGMGSATTNVTTNDYNVGTLVMDCYDVKGNKLLFQGVSQKTIQSNPAKREKTIPKTVKKLMKKFPVAPTK